MVNALTTSLMLAKDRKILGDLAKKEQTVDKSIADTKIDKDRKSRKDYNLSLISAKTIEGILRFLELETEETTKQQDLKLNQHRIET